MNKIITLFAALTMWVVASAQNIQQVTSISAGDVVILVNGEDDAELGGISTTSKKYGEASGYTKTPNCTTPLTVENGAVENSFAFKLTDGQYLCCTAVKSLNVESELSEKSSWFVSFDKDGYATIINSQDNTWKIQYNEASPRFACYASELNDVMLYKVTNYDATTVAAPVFSIASGTYNEPQSVTLTQSENHNIFYTTDGSDPKTSATAVEYVSAISVDKSMVIKAAANNDSKWSAVVSIDVNIPAPLASFMEVQSVATANTASHAIVFDNVIVTAISNHHAYMVDKNGYGAFIYADGHGFNVGDMVNGTATGDIVIYKGMTEITGITANNSGLNIEHNQTVNSTNMNISEISKKNQCSIVTVSNLTLKKVVAEGRQIILTDGNSEITIYNTFMTLPSFDKNATYSVTGVVIYFDNTLEIAPRTADDVTSEATANNNVFINNNSPVYNLMGQKVDNNYKGIVIKGSKKTINK